MYPYSRICSFKISSWQKAYETTLEGWARALELRDEETVGHSRHVTDMTVILAQALGVDDDQELVTLRERSTAPRYW